MSHTPTPTRWRFATTVALGTLATVTLLAGVPTVLWVAAEPPWPQEVASLADLVHRLRQPLGDPLVLQLLALLGWLCWAAFALAVLREAAWYAIHLPQLYRDRGLHATHLETLPGPRLLIAACIGTLALALLSTLRPPTASAHPAPSPQQQRPRSPPSPCRKN